ncbi:MAG: DUF429 domain-containing protein [Syntrophales bacterium]|nr:DUF429 domain-containing protein [Syntrophales bacterium]
MSDYGGSQPEGSLHRHPKETKMNIYSGFDSAWANNNPGALAHIEENNGVRKFCVPSKAKFQDVIDVIQAFQPEPKLHVLAIDQPTIVQNQTGMRAVERVVAKIVSRLKGGVQPSNRKKDSMFGDKAPIWGFLEQLKDLEYKEKPDIGQQKPFNSGKYYIEVYPCLNILGLFPCYYKRGKCAKYNPANRNFDIDDWNKICIDVEAYGEKQKIDGMKEWASKLKKAKPMIRKPNKSDQDNLDAVLCAVMAFEWAKSGVATTHGVVIGDTSKGYMVTVTDSALFDDLKKQNEKFNHNNNVTVPFNQLW